MARSLDTIVRDTLGNDRITEIHLQARIEQLEDEVRALKQKYEPAPAPPPPTAP